MLPWIKDHLLITELLLPCHLETLTSLLMDADLGSWLLEEGELARLVIEGVEAHPAAMLQLWRSLCTQYDTLQFVPLIPELFARAHAWQSPPMAISPSPFTVYLDMLMTVVAAAPQSPGLAEGLRGLHPRLASQPADSVPLGLERLWLVRLWRQCLSESLIEVHTELAIPSLLMALFEGHPEHSLLHNEVLTYVRMVCADPILTPLLAELMPKLPRLIMAEHARARSLSERPRQSRPTWMGHLMQMAMVLPLASTVAAVPGWESFVADHLAYYERQLQGQLGGTRPAQPALISAGSDMDEQFLSWGSTWATPQDEQLARYFCQQIIGRMAHLGILEDEEDYEEADQREEAPSIGIPIAGAGGAFDNLLNSPHHDDDNDEVEEESDEEKEEPPLGEEEVPPSSAQIRWILNQM